MKGTQRSKDLLKDHEVRIPAHLPDLDHLIFSALLSFANVNRGVPSEQGGRHGSEQMRARELQLRGRRQGPLRQVLQRTLQGRRSHYRVAVRLPAYGVSLTTSASTATSEFPTTREDHFEE